jgi:hypothetical protein
MRVPPWTGFILVAVTLAAMAAAGRYRTPPRIEAALDTAPPVVNAVRTDRAPIPPLDGEPALVARTAQANDAVAGMGPAGPVEPVRAELTSE